MISEATVVENTKKIYEAFNTTFCALENLKIHMRTTDDEPNATRKLLRRITMMLFRGTPIVARQRRTTMAH